MSQGSHIYGKYQRIVNFDKFLKAKRCIIQIRNKDKLCCARAIVTAIARLTKNPKLPSYYNPNKSNRSIQTKKAKSLHRAADVPLETCGLEEIKKFQTYLQPTYQIFIVSKDHMNGIIYSGPIESAQKIFLYYHDNHFDIITSMPAFMRRSYFCLSCHKGYNNKQHLCLKKCNSCFSDCSSNSPNWIKWKTCSKCHRSFRNKTCFRNHSTPSSPSGPSVCMRLHKCLKCLQTFNNIRRPHQHAHTCGETFCTNCNNYTPPNHLCFMKPIDPTTSATKNQTTLNELKYIFFDFECVQESGTHEPNLCIAFKVCEDCIEKPIDRDSICHKCGPNQHLFSG